MRRVFILCGLASLLAACDSPQPAALGTVERDRITLPATASEPIVEIAVREGQRVVAGDVLVRLERSRSLERSNTARSELTRLESVLQEARNGPRPERIDAAKQQLARVESLALNARRERERVEAVVSRGLLPAAERDRARSASAAADADVRAARAVLKELETGTRPEEIAQAEAAVATAQAQLAALEVDLERITITAPRAGVVDSLPYEVGDQPALGAPLAILLVGESTYARVYVPQPLRLDLKIGAAANVILQGHDQMYSGRVRTIRSEASFTPYFALSGEDAAQLSYLAEIELGADAAELALGLPVRVEFPGIATR